MKAGAKRREGCDLGGVELGFNAIRDPAATIDA